MRVLVCGSRYWTNKTLIKEQLKVLNPEVVIEGEADGADKLSRESAEELGIKVLPFPANWEKYGRAAGPIRNKQMLDEGKPDLVLAFHNNILRSKGTRNMITQAEKGMVNVQLVCPNSYHHIQELSLFLTEAGYSVGSSPVLPSVRLSPIQKGDVSVRNGLDRCGGNYITIFIYPRRRSKT